MELRLGQVLKYYPDLYLYYHWRQRLGTLEKKDYVLHFHFFVTSYRTVSHQSPGYLIGGTCHFSRSFPEKVVFQLGFCSESARKLYKPDLGPNVVSVKKLLGSRLT